MCKLNCIQHLWILKIQIVPCEFHNIIHTIKRSNFTYIPFLPLLVDSRVEVFILSFFYTSMLISKSLLCFASFRYICLFLHIIYFFEPIIIISLHFSLVTPLYYKHLYTQSQKFVLQIFRSLLPKEQI